MSEEWERELLSMCLTYRHDFWVLSPGEQDAIKNTLRPIYEHHVLRWREERLAFDRRLSILAGRCADLELTVYGLREALKEVAETGILRFGDYKALAEKALEAFEGRDE